MNHGRPKGRKRPAPHKPPPHTDAAKLARAQRRKVDALPREEREWVDRALSGGDAGPRPGQRSLV